MSLLDGLFYYKPMLDVFSDAALVEHMLAFEAGLAYAEAACGVIPASAVDAIAAAANLSSLDFTALTRDAELAGNLAIPLVKQLTAAVKAADPEAARFVHWGATSQDVIDTGFVLQAAQGYHLLEYLCEELCEALAQLARTHAETVMPGRTWLQQAVPVTLGWKAAGWLDAMLRHEARLRQARKSISTLQLGGAAGTLASLGDKGWPVCERLAERLGLRQADIAWHTNRDRVGETASVLGLVTATLGKIAQDLALLMQTEIGEVFEAAGVGRGGSSTMPQKRNPVACSAVLTAAVRTPGLVATVLTAMQQQQERGLGGWQAEWEAMPELFQLCAGALHRTVSLIAGLEVDADRMAANLQMTGGLLMAESVSMALAERVGKAKAHEMVEQGCQAALREKRPLAEVLMQQPGFASVLSEAELAKAMDARRYLGIAPRSIESVLARESLRKTVAQSKYLDLKGVRLRYVFDDAFGVGDGAKPVLVFSNSLGTDLSLWDRQMAHFSRHFRVLRYDNRGHGLSSLPPGPFTLDEIGGDLLALVDALGIELFSYCGISLGGLVGQWLCGKAEERLERVVLCNTASKIGTNERWDERIRTVTVGGMASVSIPVINGWLTPEFQKAQPGIAARMKTSLESTSVAGYAASCIAIRDAARFYSSHVTVPALVVAGTHDAATTVAQGRELAAGIPGAEFIELNAAHISNVEAWREFNEAVLGFLLAAGPDGSVTHG